MYIFFLLLIASALAVPVPETTSSPPADSLDPTVTPPNDGKQFHPGMFRYPTQFNDASATAGPDRKLPKQRRQWLGTAYGGQMGGYALPVSGYGSSTVTNNGYGGSTVTTTNSQTAAIYQATSFYACGSQWFTSGGIACPLNFFPPTSATIIAAPAKGCINPPMIPQSPTPGYGGFVQPNYGMYGGYGGYPNYGYPPTPYGYGGYPYMPAYGYGYPNYGYPMSGYNAEYGYYGNYNQYRRASAPKTSDSMITAMQYSPTKEEDDTE